MKLEKLKIGEGWIYIIRLTLYQLSFNEIKKVEYSFSRRSRSCHSRESNESKDDEIRPHFNNFELCVIEITVMS
jgi:hypothetical protein